MKYDYRIFINPNYPSYIIERRESYGSSVGEWEVIDHGLASRAAIKTITSNKIAEVLGVK